MSKQVYYDDVKIIKKPLNKRVRDFLKFFCVVVVIVMCFVGAGYLSKALTVGNLGAVIVYGSTTKKLNANVRYAVTLGEYDDRTEAEQVALGSSVQGASGYVWHGDKYYVIGSVYSTREDAEKVLRNLQESKYNTSIIEIKYDKATLDLSMYENSDMRVVDESIGIWDEVYQCIYDYSISFDKGEISHLAVSSGLSNIRGKVKAIIVDLQNLINKNTSKLSYVQSALIKLDEVLDEAILKTIDNTATNYTLRYALVNVVDIEYEMRSQLV